MMTDREWQMVEETLDCLPFFDQFKKMHLLMNIKVSIFFTEFQPLN